jgi:tetraacyldisaccharide 4'-kinase
MKIEDLWYGGHRLSWLFWLLAPLAGLFRLGVMARRLAFDRGWLASERLTVPVIVVGNLSVGGTGKTPLVLWLVDWLRAQGWQPGIILRGYAGQARDWPQAVTASSDPRQVGDEAVLLARKTDGPVVAGPDRVAAGRLLLARNPCDILVSDDGLQHYRLQRDVEILVIDGSRGFGNGFCLPAGPLREPRARARGIPLRVCTGGRCPGAEPLTLGAGDLVSLPAPGRTRPLSSLRGQRVTAVAGIGNPERFFALLRQAGLYVDARPYPDHHAYTAAEAAAWPPGPLIMTEKDAVKCLTFAGDNHWYLPVTAVPSEAFQHQLSQAISALSHG